MPFDANEEQKPEYPPQPVPRLELPIVDFSMFKNFTLKDRYRAQFRVEAFNQFNRQTFVNPYGASSGYLDGVDPSTPRNFGHSASTPDGATGNPLIGSGANRDIQFGLKLTF